MDDQHFSDDWAGEVTGLHRTTIGRMRKSNRIRPELRRLATLELGGVIGLIHSDWDGWSVSRKTGKLCAPTGWEFTPGELLAMPLRYQEIRALRYQLDSLRRSVSDEEARELQQRMKNLLVEFESVSAAVGRLRVGTQVPLQAVGDL